MPKTEVRALARRYGLIVADKPDSQDICFVPEGTYASVIEKLRPGAAEPGDIIHIDGRVLGTHEGIIHYTIGQRRGIGIGGTKEPLYVVKLNPAERQVIVGPREALLTAALEVADLNWLRCDIPEDGLAIQVKIRSTQPPVGARIFKGQGSTAKIAFDRPEPGVSPGQAAVCYDATRVLGGGWIRRTVPADVRLQGQAAE